MANRVRNGIAKLDQWFGRMPPPLRQMGRALTKGMVALLGSITGVETQQRAVALTFDDGPDPDVTPGLLDLLEARDVRATFFVLSERAEAHPDLVARTLAEGHEIALHGANHDNLTTVGLRDVIRRVRGGKVRLSRVAGGPIRLFRPPYGAQNLRTYLLTRLSGLQVVVWSVDPNDWDQISTDQIVSRALAKAKPGGIVLLHDGWSPAPGKSAARPEGDKVEVVGALLDGLADSGLEPLTVSGLMARGTPRKRIWFEAG